MDRPNRPTSPHLTIYKLQISSALSILHRISGACLLVFMTLFSWWFIALTFGNCAELLLSILNYTITKVVFFLASVGIFYHLSTGVRHLFWDLGFGFSIKALHITGWMAVCTCIILTLIFWFFIV
jgi:succinate dehydrogenase / fumarate reductase cytochrome b subunit